MRARSKMQPTRAPRVGLLVELGRVLATKKTYTIILYTFRYISSENGGGATAASGISNIFWAATGRGGGRRGQLTGGGDG